MSGPSPPKALDKRLRGRNRDARCAPNLHGLKLVLFKQFVDSRAAEVQSTGCAHDRVEENLIGLNGRASAMSNPRRLFPVAHVIPPCSSPAVCRSARRLRGSVAPKNGV